MTTIQAYRNHFQLIANFTISFHFIGIPCSIHESTTISNACLSNTNRGHNRAHFSVIANHATIWCVVPFWICGMKNTQTQSLSFDLVFYLTHTCMKIWRKTLIFLSFRTWEGKTFISYWCKDNHWLFLEGFFFFVQLLILKHLCRFHHFKCIQVL